VREEFQQAPILDPDAMAKSIRDTLPGADSDIDAGKRVIRRAEELIESGQSFTVETTLSGSTYLRMAVRAKEVGFLLAVIFVGTSSVEINIERVKVRVQKGGHDVREEDQRRRWPRTLANMKRLLPLADRVVILDNSTTQGYSLVAAGHRGFMHWNEPMPEWAEGLRTCCGQR
jgi:predicted ABC-type ATPase